MANRQAAQRSRMRKLQHISDLEGSLQKLQVGLHCAAMGCAAVCSCSARSEVCSVYRTSEMATV